MEEAIMLILLVVVMLAGSYSVGLIPLVMNLSEEKLKKVSIFGAGLLVGTALIVIIPEGIRALYTADIVPKFKNNLNPTTSQEAIGESSNEHSFTIGCALILGFIFMLLIDQISLPSSESIPAGNKNVTVTIGLVVHAAADGIALGAAATTNHYDVEMIVFLAIMLHKAPAAFGLSTFLLHAGVHPNTIRKHLGIFSVSAPLLTVLTYFGIGQEQKETLNSLNATGIAMLFSAGIFLYVATVHVLPELIQGETHNSTINYLDLEQQINGRTSTISISSSLPHRRYSNLKYTELFILVFGALLPLVLTMKQHYH